MICTIPNIVSGLAAWHSELPVQPTPTSALLQTQALTLTHFKQTPSHSKLTDFVHDSEFLFATYTTSQQDTMAPAAH